MIGYQIGAILENERRKRNINRSRFAEGVCTPQMILKIESNECETDLLLLKILFQRLGKSPDKLEFIMSKEEYDKVRARDMIEELILKGKSDKAQYLLDKYFSFLDDKVHTHKMYYYRTRAYLLARTGGSISEAKEYIIKALDITLPGWQEKPLSKFLISTYEMENLLAYGKFIYMEGDVEHAKEHFEKCSKYIDERFDDREERAKIYGKCVWLLGKVYDGKEYDMRIADLCEKALKLLREASMSYFMVPVMETITERYARLGYRERYKEWKIFLDMLKELYDEFAPDMCLDSLFFNPYQCEYHLDYEVIRGQRLSLGKSQEELIEGVFKSPETLSRIENRKSSPNKKNFEALMGKLNINKSRYSTFVASDNFEVLEIYDELNAKLGMHDYKNSDKQLKMVNKYLNLGVPENRRFTASIEITIARMKGEIETEEALREYLSMLDETYTGCKRPPLENEAIILGQIVATEKELGKNEEAIEILENVLNAYKYSDVKDKYRYRSCALLRLHHVQTVIDNGECEKAFQLSQKLITLEITCGKGMGLGQELLVFANSRRGLGIEFSEYKRLLRKSYFFSELFMLKANAEYLSNFYKEHYGCSIIEEIEK